MNETRRSLAAGTVAGIATFALAYVLTYALTISVVQDSLLTGVAEAFGDGNPAWKIVGWLLFNAQFVTTTITVDVPLLGGTDAVNFIAESESLSPALYVVPPALLTVAGLAMARLGGATELGEALRTGPTVALGYLPAAVAGAVLFAVSVGQNSGGSPTLLTAVVLAGVLYPLVFGSLGAALGTIVAE